jgi:hypothetical protein
MGDGNSLINLGDLSKPATVLIEKVSDAVGALYKPHQIKRVAKAEAEAKKIMALADIEISDIQQRAMVRLIQEEGKKQENIENITGQATTQLTDNAKPENIEDDWISHFFEKCRNVSDKEMQSLWAGILAGEANKPGKFTKRTVELVATLGKDEAHLFTSLCSFTLSGGDHFPIIFDVQDEIYQKKGINFGTLTHLENIGLLKFNNLQGYILQQLPQNVTLAHFGIPVQFKLQKSENNTLEIGHAMLTKSGQELASICGARPDIQFLKYLVEKYKAKGLEITCPIA